MRTGRVADANAAALHVILDPEETSRTFLRSPRVAVVGRRARRRGLIDVLMFEAYRCYRSPHIENPKEHM